ncbi:MAG: hypothetical protein WC861_06200 [Candidatus Micrarchaeia archaeon]|jgi:hypothetical protein
MGFLWAWVPHRKERKELDAAIKPSNAAERKALRHFGRTVSSLSLHETGLVKSEHSLEKLKSRLLEFEPPEKPARKVLMANFTQFVPPGLVLNDNLFPSLVSVLTIAGMKNDAPNRQIMLLQVDYIQHMHRLVVEIPSEVPKEVLNATMVKMATGMLSIKAEHYPPYRETRLIVHAEKA